MNPSNFLKFGLFTIAVNVTLNANQAGSKSAKIE
jgi:hypothetical protein